MRNPRNISLQSQSGGGDAFDAGDILLHEYNEAGAQEINIVADNDGNLVLKA